MRIHRLLWLLEDKVKVLNLILIVSMILMLISSWSMRISWKELKELYELKHKKNWCSTIRLLMITHCFMLMKKLVNENFINFLST